jgi:hypothetical protein
MNARFAVRPFTGEVSGQADRVAISGPYLEGMTNASMHGISHASSGSAFHDVYGRDNRMVE